MNPAIDPSKSKPKPTSTSTPFVTSRRRVARKLVTALAMLVLAGCSILETKQEDRATIYAPDPRVAADPAWPSVDWQLSLSSTTAARMIDSLRIAVRPAPNELQVYQGATWAKIPSVMLEDALLRALEDSGRIPAVARQGAGVGADYKLVLDLRRFESDYTTPDATPAATIEVNAKLLHASDQRVVASRTFLQAQPAASEAVPDVIRAFEQGLETLTGDLAGWILTSGEQHQSTTHPRPGT